mgnify:CR=1 FL=1
MRLARTERVAGTERMRQHRPTMAPPRPGPRARRPFGFTGIALLAGALSLGAASVGCTQPAARPTERAPDAANELLEAFRAEQQRPDDPRAYLALVDRAVGRPDTPGSLALALASIDALVGTGPSKPWRLSSPIAMRSREAYQRTVLRLREAWEALEGSSAELAPLLRIELARALHLLAMHGGEARGAGTWIERRGCVPAATVVGPLDRTPLASLAEPPKLASEGELGFDPSWGAGPFARATLASVHTDACEVPLRRASRYSGTREVVVDVEVPTEQRVSLRVVSQAAMVAYLGGVKLVERGVELGAQPAASRAVATMPAGITRLVVKVADRGDAGGLEIDLLGEDGLPLRTRAPGASDTAQAKPSAHRHVELGLVGDSSDATLVLAASALLADGRPRAAEHLLEAALSARREGRDAAVHLLYIRAIEAADDMGGSRRLERIQGAALAARSELASSWELRIVEAELAQRKQGYGEGSFAALEKLGVASMDADLAPLSTLELAAVAELAHQVGLVELAERAYGTLEARAVGAPMLAPLDASLHARVGREAVRAACDSGLPRDTPRCAIAKMQLGDRRGALLEVERLRGLRRAPSSLSGLELSLRIAQGDDEGALATYHAMLPAERSLLSILPVLARTGDRAAARAHALREAAVAPDGPVALSRLAASLGEASTSAVDFERRGRELVAADRVSPVLPGAATAVLRHVEHYGLDDSGLLRVLVYDLRRVAGTTDVDQGIFVEQPSVEASGGFVPLRRRVHKRDGRVLEPEAAQMALQGGSELSQLEQGDYVETYLEGWFVPSDGGELTVDTPDLLPERTSVHDAEIVVRHPEQLPLTWWSHKQLGAPTTRVEGGHRFTSYRLRPTTARRIEDGLPPIERGVRLSFGTQRWEQIGRGIGEAVRGNADADPAVARFVAEALAGSEDASPEEKIAKIVRETGRVVKVASGGELSDFAGAYGGGSGPIARAILEDGQGSRAWIVYRALRELGMRADIAVAETSPFSTVANIPPRPGRFRHPLVVARLASGDVWIDADVEGPPLPPGRISPELRGLSAILPTGEIVAVPTTSEEAYDDVKIDLALDASGTGRGTIQLVLRGRPAQSLAEAFNHVVGADRAEMLRSVVQGWLPAAGVDEVELASEEGAWEVVVRASVTIPGMCTPIARDQKLCALSGFEPVHSDGSAGTLAQWYATRGARESNLQIDTPLSYRVERRLRLPPGATVVSLPEPHTTSSPRLSASRKVAPGPTEGGAPTLVEEVALSLPSGTISAEAYGGFVEAVQSVDAAFLSGVRLRLAP